MALFPLSRRMTGAVSGGLGAIAGLCVANWLKANFQDIHDSGLLFAVIMFLASFFFITIILDTLNRINARHR